MKIGNIPTARQMFIPKTIPGKMMAGYAVVTAFHYSHLITSTTASALSATVAMIGIGSIAQRYATRKQRGGYILNKPVTVNPDAMQANLKLTQWLRDKGLHLPSVVTEGQSHQFRIIIVPNEDPASVKKLIPALSMNLGVAEDDMVWRQNFKRGKSAVLVPLPRKQWQAVPFTTEHLEANGIQHFIGCSVDGQPMILDRIVEPHALVAGSTNSGKSEVITAMIAADELNPHQPKIYVIDPKESLDVNQGYVWEDLDESTELLEELVADMKARQSRYKLAGHKDFASFIKPQTVKNDDGDRCPIMIYIDEIADIVTAVSGEARKKGGIQRHERAALALNELARKGRSAGIYLTIGIQSPKADILNTSFRNNFGCRIAMNVADQTASRVALDQNGAETLPKFGACLFKTSLHRSPILGRAAIVQ